MLTLRALVYAHRALRVDVRALGHEMIDLVRVRCVVRVGVWVGVRVRVRVTVRVRVGVRVRVIGLGKGPS